jgi:deoxyribonuclease-1-like protein
MKKSTQFILTVLGISIILIFMLIIFYAVYLQIGNIKKIPHNNLTIRDNITNQTIVTIDSIEPIENISIAAWNIQVLGDKKWSDKEKRKIILKVIRNFDIIFIQEIRDESGNVVKDICDEMKGYECILSARAGRTSSKEQYLVLYRNTYNIIGKDDLATDNESYNFWERPPLVLRFNISNYKFTTYIIHVTPDDVINELSALEKISSDENNNYGEKENQMWLGDFNTDGNYYNEKGKLIFSDFLWVISNDMDTTVAQSSNTYDRIILNHNMFKETLTSGVYNTSDISVNVSDHYPVYVTISPTEK